MKTALYIDGTGVFFRGYYGLPPLKNSKGQYLQGIIGFFNILFRTLETYKPDYFAICFDRSEETVRKQEYPEYKANRSKAPDDLYAQMVTLKEILENSNLNYLDQAGYEADDIIASLVKQNVKNVDHQYVYSSDLDLLQLSDEKTSIIKPQNGSKPDLIFTPKEIHEKYELHPNQIVDYKGLHGDSSDNLKGVPKVGKITATKLLNEFQNLETIYENLNTLTPKMQENFINNKEQAFLCKKLATLIVDLKTPQVQELSYRQIKTQNLRNYFNMLELNKAKVLLDRLIESQPELQSQRSQDSLF